MRKMLFAAAMLAAFGMTSAAQATLYDFKVIGDYTTSFQIDTKFAPNDGAANLGFAYWDVYDVPDTLRGFADIYFLAEVFGGGLQIKDFYHGGLNLLTADGPQLYTGPESAPIFKTGSFSLVQFQGSGRYTLTISEVDAAAVPEPLTLALFGAGLAGLATTRCRRKA